MAVFRSGGTMPVVRDVLMMSVMVLADALLIIFKTNSSVTDSKVSKGFPSNWVWRRKIVSDGADFLSEVIRKDIRKVVRVKC